MVLFFSGTGNSAYVAKRIGKAINDEVLNLFAKMKSNDYSKINTERPLVIVAPTYAWRIPRIVQKWIDNTLFTGNKNVYFILTCGGSIGNAGDYLAKLCQKKKMNYCGCMGITMPENYIALFSTPSKEEALRTIALAEPVIEQAIGYIKNGIPFSQTKISFKDTINSGIVNDLFYPLFVHSRKFYATNGCVSCGKCVSVCPLNNISIVNKKPK